MTAREPLADPYALLQESIAVVILMFLPSLYFTFLQEPVFMVKMGRVTQALMLPIIGLATIYLRYSTCPTPSFPKDGSPWGCGLAA